MPVVSAHFCSLFASGLSCVLADVWCLQSLNSVLILLFIPLFEFVIYPITERFTQPRLRALSRIRLPSLLFRLMESRVIVETVSEYFYRATLSVRLFVSVTSQCSMKTDKRQIMQIAPHDSPGTLVFCCQRYSRKSTVVPPPVPGRQIQVQFVGVF